MKKLITTAMAAALTVMMIISAVTLASGASVYVGTAATPLTYPADVYWNGSGFFADEDCTAGSKIVNSAGKAITDFSVLLSALEAETTIYMKAVYNVTGTVSLNGGAHTMTLKRWADGLEYSTTNSSFYSSRLINIQSSGRLTLANIIVDGGAVWTGAENETVRRGTTNSGLTAEAPMIYVNTGCTLTLNGGAVVQNNSLTAGNGGGVYNSNGMFEINGGEISGNAAVYGGGVYNNGSNADFTISNGRITGNTSSSHGGGVYNSSGIITMSSGSVSGNAVFNGSGGGVYNGGGTFIMNGGEICGNTSTASGSVFNRNGTFEMNGGKISGNTAAHGAGVYNNGTTASFTMRNGEISGNTASSEGGGVYSSSAVSLTGGTISGNTAANGGGVYNYSAGTLALSGGKLCGNTATNNGGGIYNYSNSTFSASGGTIIDNSAGSGSEVFVLSGTVTITGGSIKGISGGTVTDGTNALSCTTLTVVNAPVPETTPAAAAAAVSGVSVAGYGVNDVVTDGAGKLYFWLPSGETLTSVTSAGNSYTGSVDSGASGNLNTSASIPVAFISYSNLGIGSSLNAALTVGTPSGYQWQISAGGGTWTSISGATAQAYNIVASDADKQIRVRIAVGSEHYVSGPVTIPNNAPSFVITIPEAVAMSIADSFRLNATMNNFASGEGIAVTASSAGNYTLTQGDDSLMYKLYRRQARETADIVNSSNPTVAQFNYNGAHSKAVYYTVFDVPAYSGAYTDTLTFTVTIV